MVRATPQGVWAEGRTNGAAATAINLCRRGIAVAAHQAAKPLKSGFLGRALLATPVLLTSTTVFAHEGKPHQPRDLLFTWGLDPVVIVSLVLSGWLYFRGLPRMWREAGSGHGIRRWEAGAFAAGWLAFSPDGARAYVTAELGRNLSVIDTTTHSVTNTIELPRGDGVKPMGVVVSNDGSKIYLANGRANNVSVIDARTHQFLATIPVGQRVWGLALTRDGKKLYAANGLSNDVSVIDTTTNAVVATVKAGDGPWGIAIVGF